MLTANFGLITSPGYPHKYPANRNCTWYIYGAAGKRVHLIFHLIQIENHSNCSQDYLEVFDGLSGKNSLVKFCNSTTSHDVYSSGPYARIEFHSDGLSNDRGFQIAYNCESAGCGGVYTGSKGIISSQATEDGKYDHNVNCQYTIHMPKDIRIQIDFTKLKLEPSRECMYDKLEVSFCLILGEFGEFMIKLVNVVHFNIGECGEFKTFMVNSMIF